MRFRIKYIVFIAFTVLLVCILGWAGIDAYNATKQEQQIVLEGTDDNAVNPSREDIPEALKRTIILKYENGELTDVYDGGDTTMTLQEVEEIFDENENEN